MRTEAEKDEIKALLQRKHEDEQMKKEEVEIRGSSLWWRAHHQSFLHTIEGLFFWTPLSRDVISAYIFAEKAVSSHPNLAEEADKSPDTQTFLCCEPTLLQDCKTLMKQMQIFSRQTCFDINLEFAQQECSVSAPHHQPLPAKAPRQQGKTVLSFLYPTWLLVN